MYRILLARRVDEEQGPHSLQQLGAADPSGGVVNLPREHMDLPRGVVNPSGGVVNPYDPR